MCGIVGAVAQRNVVPILLEGLKRLEYRGYDSTGIAVIDKQLKRLRSTQRVAALSEQVKAQAFEGKLGIAHTRWATHGKPSESNAHPHFSKDHIAVVHNGIIENHEGLRAFLKEQGYLFVSQTDTEVIAHLIHFHYQGDLLLAVSQAIKKLQGAYAIAAIALSEPGRIVGARLGSPLVLGLGVEENFLASDAAALQPVTTQVIYLEEGDIVDVSLLSYQIMDKDENIVERTLVSVAGSADSVELGPYRHYMQKEIFEQPTAISDTLDGLVSLQSGLFGPAAEQILPQIEGVTILACGTSYHSGLVARYWLEAIAGIPCQVEVASEYRYRESVVHPRNLIVVISQSGETADTLAALQHAKSLGQPNTLAICNVAQSSLVRQTVLRFLTHAGLEIGVASTKAFTTQLVALYLLTLTLAKWKNRLNDKEEKQAISELKQLPASINEVLKLEPAISQWAEKFAHKKHALFLGRGIHYPIALEGALKLKEISYIHAEAYPAGELKHGPLALVDQEMPVVAIAPNDALLDKLKSNLQEVRARGGELFVLSNAQTQIQAEEGIYVITMPDFISKLSPILYTIPLQLLAYYVALQKGTDIDKPRNLAKSVTVE